ncbi:hypothetical protein ZWY2020_027020 [Hordeum vulgare]|nr:hypothetical protein ZWY2020_027020 [Hordeum vulgare]
MHHTPDYARRGAAGRLRIASLELFSAPSPPAVPASPNPPSPNPPRRRAAAPEASGGGRHTQRVRAPDVFEEIQHTGMLEMPHGDSASGPRAGGVVCWKEMSGLLGTVVDAAIGCLLQSILGSLFTQQMVAWTRDIGLAVDVEKLKLEMKYVEMVLAASEGRRIDNKPLAQSLDDLRELLYDSEDVMDELDYYRLQQQMEEAFVKFSMRKRLGVPTLVPPHRQRRLLPQLRGHPVLCHKGYLPVRAESQLDAPVRELPPYRVRYLMGANSNNRHEHELMCKLLSRAVGAMRSSAGFVFNPFDALEADDLAATQRDLAGVPVITVGPLHKLSPASSNSLLQQDRSCLDWLDAGPGVRALHQLRQPGEHERRRPGLMLCSFVVSASMQLMLMQYFVRVGRGRWYLMITS